MKNINPDENYRNTSKLLKKLIYIIPLLLFAAAIVLNIIAWHSREFCDYYVRNIFPLAGEIYGRMMDIYPFSVGEWMLFLAVLLTIGLVAGGITCLIGRKKINAKIKKYYRYYATTCLWIGAFFSLLMTLNCFISYHCSAITQRYTIGSGDDRNFTKQELTILRNYVVEQANALAEKMERDEEGYLVYDGDLKAQAKKEMQRLGKTYSELSGYYPSPKGFMMSDFFSQQYIMGYYFPFSMEANYNTQMYVANMPVTMCHELSHLKGFIYEDEANFIGYLACVDSEDDFFRYSAYLSVIYYLDRDYYQAINENTRTYYKQPRISQQVRDDNQFLTKEAWEEVEETAIFDTELVKEVSSNIVETNLTINGVEDGTISYSRVVNLLLLYYDGVLY